MSISVRVTGHSETFGVTEYTIYVYRFGSSPREVKHRYSDFRRLHAQLQESLELPPFPAKKHLFHTQAVKERRVKSLGFFLQTVVSMANTLREEPPQELKNFLDAAAMPRHTI